MFNWHKDSRKPDGYKAPAIIKVLSEVHTEQRLNKDVDHPKFVLILRFVIVLMSLGLLITTILGIMMAFKYTKPWMVWACLAGGFGIPCLLLWFAHGFK